MEMKGTLSVGDLLAAQWLHIKPRPTYAVVGVVLVVLAVLALWFSFSLPDLRGHAWLLAGPIIVIVAFAVWAPYSSIRNYRQRKSMQRELRSTVSDTGLLGQNENGHMNVPWTDYLKWKEGAKVFLLYVSDDGLHVVPKRFFQSEADVRAFREMLKAKVSAK